MRTESEEASRLPKVVFVTRCFAYGGTEKHLVELLRRIYRRAEAIVLCYEADPYSRILNEQLSLGIQVASGLIPGGLWSYYRAFTSRGTPDAVVFINGHFGIYPWQAYLAARLAGARKVIAIEQLLANPVPDADPGASPMAIVRRLFGWRARFLCRVYLESLLRDMTICVGQGVRNRLVKSYNYSEEKTCVIPNSVNVKEFVRDCNSIHLRAQLGVGSTCPLVVAVLRLAPQKRVDILLRALALLRAKHPDMQALIVGGGPLEADLKGQASALGLDGTVQFIGHTADVRPYLQSGDLYVTSSDHEGLPLAVAEAMAYELPCVATDIEGHNDLIVDGESGVLTPPGSAEALADRMSYLLEHEAERRRLGKNARERVERFFDMDTNMERIIDLALK